MAVQVSEAQSFAGLLGAEKGVHIWNGGVDGYSTWQATVRYQQVSRSRSIKHVLLTFFTGNDFQDNERFPHMSKAPLPGVSGAPIPRAPVPWLRKMLLRSSVLYAHLRIARHREEIASMTGHKMENWKDELSIFTAEGSGRLQRLQNQTARALQGLQNTLSRAKLMVAIAPPSFVIDQARAKPAMELVGLSTKNLQLDAPQQAITRLLKEKRIPHCDLSEALRQAQKISPTYFTYDGHWTAAGHQAVATELNRCLELQ